MQVSIEQVALNPGHSFSAIGYDAERLDHPYHLHVEVELAAVYGMSGVVQCGATTTTFATGDLFLFGTNVAHRFMGSAPAGKRARAEVIQFRPAIFGSSFLGLPEHAGLAGLLDRAQLGLVLRSPDASLCRHVKAVGAADYSRRVVTLLGLLAELSDRSDWSAITGAPLLLAGQERDSRRLRMVQTLLHERSAEVLREADVAREIGLSRTSFCRWIRSVTGRTFSEILNDHRVTRAVLLLQQTDAPVASVALDVGYQSLSHFYREFGRRYAVKPGEVRGRATG